MSRRYPLIAILLLGLVLLSACGQKGDLYLPDETTQEQEEKKS